MFMSNDPFLIWYADFNLSIIIQNNTLTSQPGFNRGINRPVDEVLFFFRYLFEIFITLCNIYMACTTCANTTAVMIQMDIIVFGDLQYRIASFNSLDDLRRNLFILKFESNLCQNGSTKFDCKSNSFNIYINDDA